MGSRIFLILFGLPFLCGGLWMGYLAGKSTHDWMRMQEWVPVKAYVVKGGTESHSGDDSTTYEAYAEYTYTYNGHSYTNTRVAVDDGADNIGDFQEDLGRKLARAAGRKSGIEVYVNPEEPGEAVVSRDMRWGLFAFKMLFVILFGGAGLFLVGAGVFGKLADGGNKKDVSPEIAQSPWLANKDWQTNEIKSSAKLEMYFAWGFAILWNLISSPIPFMIKEEVVDKQNWPALLGLLFPFVGIGLLVWAIRKTLEWRKFGTTLLVLDPFPGSIGGQVGGAIEVRYPYDGTTRFMLTLASIYSYETGSGDDRRQSERVLWSDTAVAHTEMGLYGTRIVFCFDVPEGLEPADAADRGRNYHLWRLTMKADLPGTDIKRNFDIPVYATKEKSRRIDSRAVESARMATEEVTELSARTRVILRPGVQGQEMFYPAGRNIGAALMLLLFGIIFGGAGVFVIWKSGWPIFAWPFGGIFALIGFAFLISGIYMPINSLTVRKDGDGGIVATRRILGIPVKTNRFYAHDVAALEKGSNFSAGQGTEQVKHFSLFAKLHDGRRVCIGESFRGHREAEAAMDIACEALGIDMATPREDAKGSTAFEKHKKQRERGG